MKIAIVKRINEGQMLPAFYGIAWYEDYRREAVCLPIPLNLVATIGREIWFALRGGFRATHLNPRAAYAQGFRDGRESVPATQSAEPPQTQTKDTP